LVNQAPYSIQAMLIDIFRVNFLPTITTSKFTIDSAYPTRPIRVIRVSLFV